VDVSHEPSRSHTPNVQQRTHMMDPGTMDSGRVLELRDLGDGTAHLQFRDQLPLELVEQIRALLNSCRASAVPC
jgi:hypothetical protein